MDDGDEDFVFYGTPIEREEDLSNRKRKKSADAGQMRSLAPWKQEVTDEEGRRRFHGAFTGGFSAGYYNTVGSKEGWTPQTFTSSRKKRAETKEQSIYNFLDDDEKAEMQNNALGTSSQFDTFGFTAAEIARKEAQKEQTKRPSIIPGPVPDEIVVPAIGAIGMRLLLKMGWRHGHAIGADQADAAYEARREARKAFLAFACSDAGDRRTESEAGEDNVKHNEKPVARGRSESNKQSVLELQPKQDLYGLGYDPFKNAPDFEQQKRLASGTSGEFSSKRSASKDAVSSKRLKMAPGFGIGALEELDIEDEDVYASGFEIEEANFEETEEAVVKDPKKTAAVE